MVENRRADAHADDERRFIENLKRLREQRGWTQTDLARKMVEAGWEKYTQMTVSRTEKMERPLRLSEAQTLAEIFGESVVKMMAPSEERAIIDGWIQDTNVMQEANNAMRSAIYDLVTYRPILEASTERVKQVDVSWASEGLKQAFGAQMQAAETLLSRTPDEVFRLASRSVSDELDGSWSGDGEHSEEA